MALRFFVFVTLLVGLWGCGAIGGGSPAERIVGRWEGDFGNQLEFYPNQVFIQTNPSGNRFAGTYTLNEDGTTIASESNGMQSQSPFAFEGDRLQIFGAELRRTGDVETDSRPISEGIVGSWQGEGGAYDFYADGTWASYVGSEVATNGGRYTISEDGATLTLQSKRSVDERPILLVSPTRLVLSSPFVYDRVADAPTRPFPPGMLNSAGEAALEEIADVRAGEVRQIEGFSVVLHQARPLSFVGGGYGALEGPYFGVELSARNDGTAIVGGPSRWRYAMLSAGGERLNEEAVFSFGFAEEFADQLPGDCVSSYYGAGFLPVNTGSLLPGAALRAWVLFKQTPGLDASELQFEVQVNAADGSFSFSQPEPTGKITFRLDGTTSMDPLPWQAPDGAPQGDTATVGTVAFSEPSIGPVVEATADDVCSSERVVSLRAVNTGAASTAAIPPSGVLLLDSLGRAYTTSTSMTTRSMSGEYSLGPREEKTVGFPYPATFGVRDGAAAIILVDGEKWYQLPLE